MRPQFALPNASVPEEDARDRTRNFRTAAAALLLIAGSTAGCAVVTVADAVVDVAATTVKIGAKVVETTVDVAATGVKAVAGSSDKKP